jgi:hypothetical protein
MWPRGYPLELIAESASNHCQTYVIFDKSRSRYPVPLIQQGLVDGDPDVDAIYRLTRKLDSQLLNVEFDEFAPPLVLKPSQYAPINSQNTLYHHDAFWSMLFPVNVTFREVDILRGYVSVRMLQEIDARVAFTAPNAFQIRNAHSYHADYKEEKRLYEDIRAFVNALHAWKCHNVSLESCLIECVRNLVAKKLLDEVEIGFVEAWIKTLTEIGYKFPKIGKKPGKSGVTATRVFYKSIEQAHSSNSNLNEQSLTIETNHLAKIEYMSKKCKIELNQNVKFTSYDQVLLIVSARNNQELEYIDLFLSTHFNYMAVCVYGDLANLNVTNYLQSSSGLLLIKESSFKKCIDMVFQIAFKQQAFLVVKDAKKLTFWSKEFKFEDEKRVDFDKKMYFMRKNVANGIKLLKIGYSKESNYCKMLKSGGRRANVVEGLRRAVDGLHWHQNDLPAENCHDLESKSVWIPDLHDGPRVDTSSLLVHLGQRPILAGTKYYDSPFPETIRLSQMSARLSVYIEKYSTLANQALSRTLVEENYQFYKKDAEFSQVDFVFCAFPSSMCEGFMPLNKTLIVSPAHRYNIGRCDRNRWEQMNANYYRLKSKRKLIVSAMSRYDEEYMAHFSGLRQYRLYAYGGYYAKHVKYDPFRKEILVG